MEMLGTPSRFLREIPAALLREVRPRAQRGASLGLRRASRLAKPARSAALRARPARGARQLRRGHRHRLRGQRRARARAGQLRARRREVAGAGLREPVAAVGRWAAGISCRRPFRRSAPGRSPWRAPRVSAAAAWPFFLGRSHFLKTRQRKLFRTFASSAVSVGATAATATGCDCNCMAANAASSFCRRASSRTASSAALGSFTGRTRTRLRGDWFGPPWP